MLVNDILDLVKHKVFEATRFSGMFESGLKLNSIYTWLHLLLNHNLKLFSPSSVSISDTEPGLKNTVIK